MAKRKAVGFLISEMGLSERKACRIVGLSRSVQQYRSLPKNDGAAIKHMKQLASENRRYGYLRLHAMLRREGLVVNHKRTYRLYTEHGLQVRTKKRRKLPRRDRVAPQVPEKPMQRWSMDFVSDQLADCRRFRVLNIVDGEPLSPPLVRGQWRAQILPGSDCRCFHSWGTLSAVPR